MNESNRRVPFDLLQKYIFAPIKDGPNLLNFTTGNEEKSTKRAELRRAHEKLHGEPPNAFEEMLYSWLTVAGIEAKIIELNQKSEANKTAQ